MYVNIMHYILYTASSFDRPELSLSLLCFQFYLLFLPEFPIIFTHYSYFIPMSSPIIPVIFFEFLSCQWQQGSQFI